MAISAAHEPEAKLRQAHRAIAQVVLLPAPIGQPMRAKESLGNVAVARVIETAIQRPQREQQAIASVRRQCGRIGPETPARQRPSEPQGRDDPDLEQAVERQQDGGEFCPFRALVSEPHDPRAHADQAFAAVHSDRIAETVEVEAPDEALQLRR